MAGDILPGSEWELPEKEAAEEKGRRDESSGICLVMSLSCSYLPDKLHGIYFAHF